jgi:hypothetical protein
MVKDIALWDIHSSGEHGATFYIKKRSQTRGRFYLSELCLLETAPGNIILYL